LPDHIEPIEAREHSIEQDRVVVVLLAHPKRFCAV